MTMNYIATRARLADFFRMIERSALPKGWLYVEPGPISSVSRCVILDEDAANTEWQDSPDFLDETALSLGFPNGCLDTLTFKDVVEGVWRLTPAPTDDHLVRALVYYLDFDAFLPSLDAPDPPPWDEVQAAMDREFYQSLGPERAETLCRADGCDRGAVAYSVLCRPHHFISIKRRACPFSD